MTSARGCWLAGYSEVDTTPSGDTVLGRGQYGITPKLKHRLHGRVLALDDGSRRAVLVNVDLVGLRADWCDCFRAALTERFGLARDDCVVTCTHTHCAPSSLKNRGQPSTKK